MPNLLNGKHAVVFGAGGSIGAAVASEFAAQGAEVFLSGRSESNVESVLEKIIASGGRAHASQLDVLDDDAVNAYVEDIAKRVGASTSCSMPWVLVRGTTRTERMRLI